MTRRQPKPTRRVEADAEQEEQDELIDGLDPRETLFVLEYMSNGFRKRDAAVAAGYSPRSAHVIANRLLKKDKIKAYIEQRLNEHAMPFDEVLARLTDIARADFRDVADADGHYDYQVAKAAGKTHLIREVTKKTIRRGETETVTVTAKIHDSVPALLHLWKHWQIAGGKATERNEIDISGLTDTERLERLATLLESARARRDGRAATGGE